MTAAGRLDHRDALDHADVAGEIVPVGRRYFEFDVAVGLRVGHAPLHALDHGVESTIDPVAKPLRHRKRAMLGGEHEAEIAIGEGDAASGYPGPDLGL